jgi:hypothetical protein
MASKAQSGRGTQISIGTVAGGVTTWTPIGECKSAPLEGAKFKTVDVTNFDSGLDDEFITTTRDPGESTFEGNRNSSDAGQVLVTAAYQSGLIVPFKVVLPINTAAGQTTQGDVFTFNALVLSTDFPVSVEGAITFKVGVKKTGPTVLTVGS